MAGDRRSLARLITAIENGKAAQVLQDLEPGKPHVVGVTGPPGAGKSTLVDLLITEARNAGNTVAGLLVDPSSPFSGGAILGDRVRMQNHITDKGVYLRSLANRGHLGGLSHAVPAASALLSAIGFDVIIIETVGVGQAEVDIVRHCDTVVVILSPGWGDGIQAAKAGLMEIGDVFVVNKADRDGVEQTVSDVKQMLMLGEQVGGPLEWEPPVLESVATTGAGIGEIWAALVSHREYLDSSNEGQRRTADRWEAEFRAALHVALIGTLDSRVVDELVADVRRGVMSPYLAAERALSR
ncbi:MAG: methylmalonyl Co-A mutase-associated GTPase MeaB [Acidimicrobiia bacterium]|nr:methylmalonyl Co-A mutase-associated GTPase MeaB [Acidimicrobiia bacterium]MBT8251086.1 methylmalonyl Co-A mutase-associated GTPase MeaB [Acidimicrobiia bacterium]NNC42123.1 methylmalonyl Co-A mutase-associated GTPase MeaB [Acidimicrobiia bacterium]NNL29251.1 methylmalonyl Co-A mutase-associated GTPase MeaB [Acidimicrobiia bacterium]